jgi:uncharacterized coiled-coil protein SlyX
MAENMQFTSDHFKMLTEHETKIEEIEKKTDKLGEISETLQVLKTLQLKQDEYNIRFEERFNETNISQIQINAEVSKTLNNINHSLDSMNTKLDQTNGDVAMLKKKFEDSENKNMIDTRVINKEEIKKKLSPTQKGFIIGGGSVAIIVAIIEALSRFIK